MYLFNILLSKERRNMVAYEPAQCLWCTGPNTRERIIEVHSGKQKKLSSDKKEMVICTNCDNNLPSGFMDRIKLILDKRPELKDYLYTLTEEQLKNK